jgi:hypothetical protein
MPPKGNAKQPAAKPAAAAPKAKAAAPAPAAKKAAAAKAPAAAPKKEVAAPAKPAPQAKAAAPQAKAAKKVEGKAKAGSGTGIYIKNWCAEGSEFARTLFGNCGKVTDIRLRRNVFALVWFDHAAAVQKAMQSFNGKVIKGSALAIKPAKAAPPADKHNGSSVVFVAPVFRGSTSRSQLFKAFKPSGNIKKMKMYKNNTAYIYFENAAGAAKAIKDMNGKEFGPQAGKPGAAKLRVKASVRSLAADAKKEDQRKRFQQVYRWKREQRRDLTALKSRTNRVAKAVKA